MPSLENNVYMTSHPNLSSPCCFGKSSHLAKHGPWTRAVSCPVPLQDPQYIQQALTHVLLMDAVVSTLQSPSAIYAASKLSYFDKMKNESKISMCLTSHVVLECVLIFTRVTIIHEIHNFSFFFHVSILTITCCSVPFHAMFVLLNLPPSSRV